MNVCHIVKDEECTEGLAVSTCQVILRDGCAGAVPVTRVTVVTGVAGATGAVLATGAMDATGFPRTVAQNQALRWKRA
ncbi:hypothetical protein M8818_000159 [Zalaria obscura]|uniref:Uncharacterized protein n=1 Tax=Zalaria obscura TaxID=2024903 RepID=A0ACC3SR41_9PEZI